MRTRRTLDTDDRRLIEELIVGQFPGARIVEPLPPPTGVEDEERRTDRERLAWHSPPLEALQTHARALGFTAPSRASLPDPVQDADLIQCRITVDAVDATTLDLIVSLRDRVIVAVQA